MHTRTPAGLLLGVLFLLSACAPATGDAPPSAPEPKSADAAFVRAMVAYHDHNLAVLALADARVSDVEVKTIAAQTADLQRLQRTTMVTLLAGWAQPTEVPATADSHPAELADLRAAAFDRALVAALVTHNDTAVRYARSALAQDLSDKIRGVAVSVDRGLSAENAALRALLTRL
ncbi:uncharacterized protein (DUF305 family) [Hamadaea flava]|uniref:DUF305 domain-containing protein n=1 Tax=Hamadaea flava TaxID=1742688 RepID=A0ABV8LY44_9ACTN|nr:DUF305 domain-containing protein [Hamadaea flava]MCP2329263.1 uncharacterized protein (DUF305 family) [Hamadaea flava]